MSDAVRLYLHDFAGDDAPGVVDAWTGFEVPLLQDAGRPLLNPQTGLQSGINAPVDPYVNEPFIPTIDGGGHGIGPRGFSAFAYLWAVRSENRPGRQDYRATVRARWKAPGNTTYGQGVGPIVRFRDAKNYAVARLVANNDGTPTLRIFTVEDGVETARGDAYSGSDVEEADLANWIDWGLAVYDNADGTTTFTAYVGGSGGASRGTQRATWSGAVPNLRGTWGTGVELSGGVSGDDVLVDAHAVYDLSDSASGSDLEDGSGWVLEIDGVRYPTADFATMDPKVHDLEVTQTFPAAGGGCTATIVADGDWVLKAGLRPGRNVVVYHHGAVRFRGLIVSGQASATPAGSQRWTAMDAVTLAGLVDIAEDDGTSSLSFNLTDTTSDYYDTERQDMTLGDVLDFLGERYRAALALRGAAPLDGSPVFDSTETAALTAVVPGLVVSGSFAAAVFQVLAKTRKWQVFVDPATLVWHLRDITGATAQAIECTAEWVRPSVQVDARRAITAFEFVGTRGESDETDLSLGVPGSSDNLAPQWTAAQEAGSSSATQTKQTIQGTIAGAGAETFRGQTRTFLQVSSSYGLTEDQVRGAICNGEFVVGNTATKIYLSPAAWPGGDAPDPGDPFTLTLLDERAQWWLSSMGVGRSFRAYGVPTICGVAATGLAQGGLDKAKACGVMRIGEKNPVTGTTSWEEVDFGIHAPSDEAIGAGFCDPVVVLAKKPERTLGLVNYLGAMPGGSPPLDQCSNPAVAIPEVQIQGKVKTLGDVPRVRVPTEEDTYEGRAWTEWGWARLQRIELQDFTSMDQADGLELAGQALLDVMGDLPMLFTAEISTPWQPHAAFPQHVNGYPSSTWAGLTKRVRLLSRKRTTGFEEGLNLVVYSVTWSLLRNTTTIQAGTAAGWLNLAAEEIARTFLEKPAQVAAAQSIRTLRDVVACLNGKSETTVPAQPAGPIPGCKVEIVDTVRRTTVDVNIDDENKKSGIQHVHLEGQFGRAAAGLGSNPFPGQPIEMPGYDHDDGRAFPKGSGSIPRTLPTTWLPGPIAGARGSAGVYGGPPVADKTLAGRPPDLVGVFRWGTVRKAADASGDRAGGEGLEWSPNDAQGAPTGSWSPLSSLLDLGPAGLPLRDAVAGSYPAQLAARDAAVAARLGIVIDSAGRVLIPGTVTADYPDGVPADHATTLLAASVARDLRPVWSTLSDPGGLVLHGPVGADGADAGLDWRVLAPGHALVLVEAVTAGTGKNGGSWDDIVEADDTYTVLRGGGVVHKQVDAPALRSDRGGASITAEAPAALSDDPFCFTGAAGRILSAGAGVVSGAGGILSMPPHAVGAIAVAAHLKEVSGGTPEASGRSPSLALAYSVQGSAWSAEAATAAQEPELTDGGGEGTAVALFLVPGGAVPAGLRRPFDLALSVQRDGDGGDMTGDAILTGLGVDVPVAERSSMHRVAAGVGAGGALVDNHPIVSAGIGVGGSVVDIVEEPIAADVGVAMDGRLDTAPWRDVFAAIGASGTVTDLLDPLSLDASITIRGRVVGRLT